MYYQTIYTRGHKAHLHVSTDGSRLSCYRKHGKPKLPLFGLTVALLGVEIVLGLILLVRAL